MRQELQWISLIPVSIAFLTISNNFFILKGLNFFRQNIRENNLLSRYRFVNLYLICATSIFATVLVYYHVVSPGTQPGLFQGGATVDWHNKINCFNSRLVQKPRKLKILIQFLFNYRQDIFEIHVITMTTIDININILISGVARGKERKAFPPKPR